MDLLHTTWFWVLIILGQVITVLGILARLARKEPPAAVTKRVRGTAADEPTSRPPPSELPK